MFHDAALGKPVDWHGAVRRLRGHRRLARRRVLAGDRRRVPRRPRAAVDRDSAEAWWKSADRTVLEPMKGTAEIPVEHRRRGTPWSATSSPTASPTATTTSRRSWPPTSATTPPSAPASPPSGCSSGSPATAGSRSASGSASTCPTSRSPSRTRPRSSGRCSACSRLGATRPRRSARRMQNSLPSGSASTTQVCVALADVDPRRAQGLGPGHLGGLVVGPEVEVEAVLHRLARRAPRGTAASAWPGAVRRGSHRPRRRRPRRPRPPSRAARPTSGPSATGSWASMASVSKRSDMAL